MTREDRGGPRAGRWRHRRLTAREPVRTRLAAAHRHRDLARDVEAAISQWDPIGLVAAGAPEGEYEAEAREIARCVLRDARDAADTAAIVQRVLTAAFGDETYDSGALAAASRAIWAKRAFGERSAS